MRFDAFVILGAMRTGSNLLEAALAGLDGITMHGEAFNPAMIGAPKRTEILGIDRAARDRDPLALLAAIRGAPGLNGFRYFDGHDPRVLGPVLDDPGIAKIVLTRNPLESYVSLGIARVTNQWRLTAAKGRRQAQAHFDAAEFAEYLDAARAFQERIRAALQTSGQAAFQIDYGELTDLDRLNGLVRFLGAPGRLEGLPANMVPQNPEPLADKVDNPDEMAQALAALDPFQHTRLPDFEVRAGGGIAGTLAARALPLLALPLAGGPAEEVAAWLDRLGGSTAVADLGGLRDWRKANPGHRGFVVLRHPLHRAWAAFTALPRQGPRAAALAALGLPPEGDDRAARFARFLDLLRETLDGQTPLPTIPAWRSQQALLESLGRHAPPDLIAREATMADELGALAARLGATQPGPAPSPLPADLAAMIEPGLVRRAAAAYRRDFALFGFPRRPG